MKQLRLAGLLLILSGLLCSCGDGAREFLATLGFDTHDYDGEAVIETYDTESEQAQELAAMLEILTLNNPEIPVFSGGKEAVDLCRDSVLNYLLNHNYSKYTGNLELLDRTKEAYPHIQITSMIPADDFETTVYTYFGGKERITNEDSALFVYLDKVDAYTTVAQPQESRVVFHVQLLEETENTYRMVFTCTLDETESDEYETRIIKREDGNSYFRYVRIKEDQ